ncbi:MAG: glycosyltransferase family 1 protein [bacterium]|nr:glycosyltransferase family 1 protein [bacterium]
MILGIDASRAVKKEKTGVEWYSYFLLRAMEKCMPEGWRVKCYVSSLPSPDPIAIGSPSPAGRGEGEGNWQWRVLKWIGRGWTQVRLSLEMIKSPPDVLFVPSHVIPLVHPKDTITTVHDVIFLTHPELYNPEDLEAQKRGLEFALNFARKIIVPTRAVRDDLMRAGAKEGQVVVVPHGVDMGANYESIANSRISNSEIRKFESHSQFAPPYILFIGRIEKKKNVLGLIHAFRRLIRNAPPSPDLRPPSPAGRGEGEGQLKLVLAGSLGYGGEDVLEAIKTFRLEDRVIHLGYVSRADYLALLRNAALLVVPSFGEGFGLPVIEAMAEGVPVVCSDIPSLREVGGNAAHYVNPNEPEDIARGIATVLDNEMLQSEMVQRGKERAREFTWERTAKETWEVILGL